MSTELTRPQRRANGIASPSRARGRAAFSAMESRSSWYSRRAHSSPPSRSRTRGSLLFKALERRAQTLPGRIGAGQPKSQPSRVLHGASDKNAGPAQMLEQRVGACHADQPEQRCAAHDVETGSPEKPIQANGGGDKLDA